VKLKVSSDLVMGDVDGDGAMDLLVTVLTDSSTVMYAFKAKDGKDLDGFPKEIKDYGKNESNQLRTIPNPLLVMMHSPPMVATSAHIIQPLHSNLYIIDGSTGCAQKVYIGNEISSIQSVDVSGNGSLDLVGTSTSGEVFTVETPMQLSTVKVQSLTGIFVDEHTRKWRDVVGFIVPVTFEIWDDVSTTKNNKYDVELRVGRSADKVVFRKEYNAVGTFTENVILRFPPGHYTITVRLRTTDGLVYDDEFHFAFNANSVSYILTSMILVPLIVTSFALLFTKRAANADDGILGGVMSRVSE